MCFCHLFNYVTQAAVALLIVKFLESLLQILFIPTSPPSKLYVKVLKSASLCGHLCGWLDVHWFLCCGVERKSSG